MPLRPPVPRREYAGFPLAEFTLSEANVLGVLRDPTGANTLGDYVAYHWGLPVV